MDKLKSEKTRNMRQKLFLIYHEDGILDLAVGITILLLAAVFAFEISALIGFIGIPIVFYVPLKEQVAIPRIGFIQFESEGMSKRKMVSFLLTGFIVFLGVALFLIFRGALGGNLIALIQSYEIFIFAGILGGSLWGVALFLKNTRFVYYTILAIALVVAAHFLGIGIWIALVALGIAIEAVGMFFLVRFTKQYPITKEQ